MGLKVVLMYNLQSETKETEDDPPDGQAELDSESTILAIRDALEQAGCDVTCLDGELSAVFRLTNANFDLAFNICEGRKGRNREAQIPAVLEMIGIPYTGSDVLTLAVCLDKAATKKLLAYDGIPTPVFQVFHGPAEPLNPALRFPLFVKPVHEGSSMGIDANSKVCDEAELRRQVDYVCSTYRQPALVEEFIAGREFTIGVIGNGIELRTLPIMEIDFSKVPATANNIYTYQFKKEWSSRENFLCPAPLDEATAERMRHIALQAFTSLGCRDYARVDFRLSNDGIPYVIEVNPLPGLAPGYSDFPVAAEVAGLQFPQLIAEILNTALCRLRGVTLRARRAT